jgi:tripartite-type tricarboxylate transporter receptor subunit TctC
VKQIQSFTSLALCAAFGVAAHGALAQATNWPERQVRIVMPFPTGGASDVLTRILADQLQAKLGQTFVVDNRTGAGGNIGMEAGAKAAPDGYTLTSATIGTLSINQYLFKSLPYNPERDFTYVSTFWANCNVVMVSPQHSQAKTMKEFLAWAKAQPKGITFGSSGVGTTPHLAGELFNTMAGTKITHVPYKGSAPMVVDLLGGQVQVAFDNTVIPNIKAGKLRGLAVTGPARLAAVADIPTAAEAGLPAYEAVGWMGLYGPKGLPMSIRNRLAAETAKAAATPDFIAKMEGLGFQARTGSPAEFDAYLKTETSKWAKVVKDAGVPQE